MFILSFFIKVKCCLITDKSSWLPLPMFMAEV